MQSIVQGTFLTKKKNSFFCPNIAIDFFAQIRNAEETLVLSDALLLAARVSCSSKQVVNNNNANNSDDHAII